MAIWIPFLRSFELEVAEILFLLLLLVAELLQLQLMKQLVELVGTKKVNSLPAAEEVDWPSAVHLILTLVLLQI